MLAWLKPKRCHAGSRSTLRSPAQRKRRGSPRRAVHRIVGRSRPRARALDRPARTTRARTDPCPRSGSGAGNASGSGAVARTRSGTDHAAQAEADAARHRTNRRVAASAGRSGGTCACRSGDSRYGNCGGSCARSRPPRARQLSRGQRRARSHDSRQALHPQGRPIDARGRAQRSGEGRCRVRAPRTPTDGANHPRSNAQRAGRGHATAASRLRPRRSAGRRHLPAGAQARQQIASRARCLGGSSSRRGRGHEAGRILQFDGEHGNRSVVGSERSGSRRACTPSAAPSRDGCGSASASSTGTRRSARADAGARDDSSRCCRTATSTRAGAQAGEKGAHTCCPQESRGGAGSSQGCDSAQIRVQTGGGIVPGAGRGASRCAQTQGRHCARNPVLSGTNQVIVYPAVVVSISLSMSSLALTRGNFRERHT